MIRFVHQSSGFFPLTGLVGKPKQLKGGKKVSLIKKLSLLLRTVKRMIFKLAGIGALYHEVYTMKFIVAKATHGVGSWPLVAGPLVH